MSEVNHVNAPKTKPMNLEKKTTDALNSKPNSEKQKRRRKKKSSQPVVSKSSANNTIPVVDGGKNRNLPKPGVSKPTGLSTLNLPNVKVVIRNVKDVEKFGSVSKMIAMIRSVVDSANTLIQGNKFDAMMPFSGIDDRFRIPLVLEEESIEKLKFIENAMSRQQDKNEIPSSNSMDVEEKIAGISSSAESQPNTDSWPKDGSKPSDVTDKVPNGMLIKNLITIRVSYIVPPRKSRRRGELPGRAYVILYPPMPPHIWAKVNSSSNVTVDSNDSALEKAMMLNAVTLTPDDRSTAVAQCRLILKRTVWNMDKACANATSLSPGGEFGRAKCETCLNQKSWKLEMVDQSKQLKGSTVKHPVRQAKLDSTIENSEDYKNFLEKRARLEEERLSRPKPAPGGGSHDHGNSTSADGAGGKASASSVFMENGVQLSAIVLHLRAKREAEAKKSSSESKKKTSALSQSTKSTTTSAKSSKLRVGTSTLPRNNSGREEESSIKGKRRGRRGPQHTRKHSVSSEKDIRVSVSSDGKNEESVKKDLSKVVLRKG